jgi:hypothetical protein
VSAASCRRGRVAARRSRRIEDLFDRYLDHVMDCVVRLGVAPALAMDAIFTTVLYLAEQKALPPFPGVRASMEVMGRWVIAAADFDLPGLLERSIRFSAADSEGSSS